MGGPNNQTESESEMDEWTDGWIDGEEDNDGQTDEVDEWKMREKVEFHRPMDRHILIDHI